MLGIVPLGDQALLASFAEESQAFAFARQVRSRPPAWLIDVVQAYKTVAVFFDLLQTSFSQAAEWAKRCDIEAAGSTNAGSLHVIPCCYELGLDLERVAAQCSLSPERVIGLHSGVEYTVYAIGFCPGFPYLGYLPRELEGVPRLPSPRLRVEGGSVGLTGRQTGIYTEERPGGWNLIGRTPLKLVDVEKEFFPLRTGDRVRFEAISLSEFKEWNWLEWLAGWSNDTPNLLTGD